MAKLSFFLMVFAAAATLSMVWGACDYLTDCIYTPSGDVAKQCQNYKTYQECLQKKADDTTNCAADKTSIEVLIDSNKDTMDKLDCGTAGLVASLVVTLGLSSLVYFLTSSQ